MYGRINVLCMSWRKLSHKESQKCSFELFVIAVQEGILDQGCNGFWMSQFLVFASLVFKELLELGLPFFQGFMQIPPIIPPLCLLRKRNKGIQIGKAEGNQSLSVDNKLVYVENLDLLSKFSKIIRKMSNISFIKYFYIPMEDMNFRLKCLDSILWEEH